MDIIEKKTDAETKQQQQPKFAIKLTSISPPQWTLFDWSRDYNRWSIIGAFATREVAFLTMKAKATNSPVTMPAPEYFGPDGEPTAEDPKRRFY